MSEKSKLISDILKTQKEKDVLIKDIEKKQLQNKPKRFGKGFVRNIGQGSFLKYSDDIESAIKTIVGDKSFAENQIDILKEIENYIKVNYPDDWFLPGKLDILRLKFLSELKQQKIDDLKKQIDSIFKTDSGRGEDGKTFAILQKNGEYSKEYLDMENTVFEDGSVDKDGSFRRTEIAPANSALIASTSTAQLNNLVNNYLANPSKANKVFMEVLPNNEKPLEKSLDGSITPKDVEIFRKQVLEYGRKQLPNYNVIGQETVIDYKKRLDSRIKEAEKTEGTKKDKAQAVKEVAKELVADLVEDPEAFLTRHMQEEDFDMTQGPGAKGFSVIEVDDKGNESRYTYDLTNPSDIERFFRLEIDLGTKAEETKILNEINKIAGVSKDKYNKFLIKE